MLGRNISHFRILQRIGEGGMGVVYRAEDEKLQRVVALKVLPPERLADEERRRRFVREARMAAAVTHPNIAVVHEIDESDGVVFIAMELIEGRTLRAVIGGKPLALREGLRLGLEIAEGLSAAHHARVIHRDLKPDNVIVTQEGRVKILDFGLAKLLEERQAVDPEVASRLETISNEMTQAGRVLGTPAYMSPEQARGLPVDARSDLFSFGVVLYEMVTGRPPFGGSTSMDVMNALIHREAVAPSHANPEVPEELERIVGKCLQKDPAERYQGARDLVVDLRKLKRDTESRTLRKEGHTAPVTVRHARGRSGRVKWLLWPTAGLVVLGVAGVAAWRFLPRQEPKRELIQRQITANPPENPVRHTRISPDGRFLAYFDQGGIQVRRIETGETQPLRLPEGFDASTSDWHPDGTGMLVAGAESPGRPRSLWNVSLLGGAPRKIFEDVREYSMSPDGKHLVYTNGASREIWMAGPQGEAPRSVMAVPEGELLDPFGWSPNSGRFGYRKRKLGSLACTLGSRDPEGGPEEEIFLDLSVEQVAGAIPGFWWLPDGRFLYPLPEPPPNETDVNLWAVKVDPVSGKRSGTATRITNWVGAKIGLPSATTDGKRLAVLRTRAQTDIYLAELEPGGKALRSPRRFTMDERDDLAPTWTPDSRYVVFSSSRGGTFDVFKQHVDGSTVEAVVAAPDQQIGITVAPDGRFVYYSDLKGSASFAAALRSADGTLMRAPLAGGPPQAVLDKKNALVSCPSTMGTSCVIREFEGERMVFSGWEPDKGTGAKSATLDKPGGGPFSLSPDGSRIAIAPVQGGVADHITIVTLADGTSRILQIDKDLIVITGLAWSASMDALFATVNSRDGRGAVVRIDSAGRTSLLLDLQARIPAYPAPSPDGRHLAWMLLTHDANVWLLENF